MKRVHRMTFNGVIRWNSEHNGIAFYGQAADEAVPFIITAAALAELHAPGADLTIDDAVAIDIFDAQEETIRRVARREAANRQTSANPIILGRRDILDE